MASIRLINTETLRMKMFVGASVPPYAILSHTWVEDEEVSFQEMSLVHPAGASDINAGTRNCACTCHCSCCRPGSDSDPTVAAIKAKSGYDKIVRTCRLAKDREIGYAWVDTCCIDKTSSAELTEAINAMYQWYSSAVECYALLTDLQPFVAYSEHGDEIGGLDKALEGCRWFTRGWCLQELIAPKELLFFNREWRGVGSKLLLREAIEKITGISKDAFNHKQDLRHYSAATKMFWASKRTTTRTEDMAYCLVGLFGINMPLLYGEGAKAFQRLQEEILRRSDDLSIFCWSPPVNEVVVPEQSTRTCRDLLAPSPAEFGLSRWTDPELQSFDNGLAKFSVTNKGLLVQGGRLAPIPKTQGSYYSLALKCRHRQLNTGWMTAVLNLRWIGPSRYERLSWQGLSPTTSARHLAISRAMDDFYIITREVYEEIAPSLKFYLDENPRLQLRLKPTANISVMQLNWMKPQQNWDMAALRFVGDGCGCIGIGLGGEAVYRGSRSGSWTVNLFIGFRLTRLRNDCHVSLYSIDEWVTERGFYEDPDWLSDLYKKRVLSADSVVAASPDETVKELQTSWGSVQVRCKVLHQPGRPSRTLEIEATHVMNA
ncbi:hypothetical protein GGTG_07502 [Gaeumannomyces tritici R3-111a-1]|uniref:Uncharacterized protein n=1 Tax=Gaeumannomyces tritici (strain R3-111a-1) TaxID=644352 RepID=J3P1V4_GAET3|nr:hypothetical protein GGTG_07502 [Gaeumannomyces tritici R3-111a-1]EJT73646.1 hypothetical protein GGTG_07502 [Gaeumannomyces tritici R3-111a-1]